MKTDNATPRPWNIGIRYDDMVYIQSVTEAPYLTICSMKAGISCANENYISRQEREANAEFIVRAVNSHEALVEALKNIFKHTQGECEHEDIESCTLEIKSLAENALKLVEGEA